MVFIFLQAIYFQGNYRTVGRTIMIVVSENITIISTY